MAYRRKPVKKHPAAKDKNYYPRDNPKLRAEFHKERHDAIMEERRNNAMDAIYEKWQLNPPKSPEGYPRPTGKKKRKRNTSIGARSSSLKINRPSSGWGSTLNL